MLVVVPLWFGVLVPIAAVVDDGVAGATVVAEEVEEEERLTRFLFLRILGGELNPTLPNGAAAAAAV